MSTVGFIGLGNMGTPMAGRLAGAGHRLIVHDQSSEAVEAFRTAHPGSSTAEETGWQDAETIITMLPTSDIVEQVLLEGSATADARASTLFIDMSSAEPTRSHQLGEALAERGMRYVDAPVSGGVQGAVEGRLAIMVGGAVEDVDQAMPLFEAMGRSIIRVGAAGAGHAAKALNNLVSAATVTVTSEALHIGKRFGIDPQILTDVLNSSSGRSATTENKVARFMLSGSFDSGFPIGLMSKDVNIALALAADVGAEAVLSRCCADLWRAAVADGHAREDHTKMYAILGRGASDGSDPEGTHDERRSDA